VSGEHKHVWNIRLGGTTCECGAALTSAEVNHAFGYPTPEDLREPRKALQMAESAQRVVLEAT